MSDEAPASNNSPLQNPQVMIALITGIVSILIAIIGLMPTIIAANTPPTATPTATYTHTPTIAMTNTAAAPPVATAISTEIILPSPTEPLLIPTTADRAVVIDPAQEPNVLLLWDNVSFTLVNRAGGVLSLADVKFRSDSGKWDAKDWGPSIYTRLPADNCLRLRDTSASPRNPPGECGELFGLILVGDSALFWLNTAEFEVRRNQEVLATCNTDAGNCAVFIPQD